jgi:hypothetical protein
MTLTVAVMIVLLTGCQRVGNCPSKRLAAEHHEAEI